MVLRANQFMRTRTFTAWFWWSSNTTCESLLSLVPIYGSVSYNIQTQLQLLIHRCSSQPWKMRMRATGAPSQARDIVDGRTPALSRVSRIPRLYLVQGAQGKIRLSYFWRESLTPFRESLSLSLSFFSPFFFFSSTVHSLTTRVETEKEGRIWERAATSEHPDLVGMISG